MSLLMPSTGICTAFAASGVKLFASAASSAVGAEHVALRAGDRDAHAAGALATNTPTSAKRDAGCRYLT